ncbi:MAG: manganese catalase family protein [Clostridia bacterium]|nr:manganese catalase family protein [Clostridia bacterium]
MGLKFDAPYPSLDGITEDYQTLRLISPAYAGREGELTATLQYVYQSVFLGANGMQKESKLLLDIAVTEMHHIQILGTLITKLGAPPVFTSCPPYPVGFYSASYVNYVKNPLGMIGADIIAERGAIAEYHRILGSLNNQKVYDVIERIIEDEKVHVAALEKLFGELKENDNC